MKRPIFQPDGNSDAQYYLNTYSSLWVLSFLCRCGRECRCLPHSGTLPGPPVQQPQARIQEQQQQQHSSCTANRRLGYKTTAAATQLLYSNISQCYKTTAQLLYIAKLTPILLHSNHCSRCKNNSNTNRTAITRILRSMKNYSRYCGAFSTSAKG